MLTQEQRQDIFTQVVTHMLSQGAKSIYGRASKDLHLQHTCRYRGDYGRKCAIGCLIADEHYAASLEGHGVQFSNIRRAVELSLGVSLGDSDIDMLTALQETHDGFDPSKWRGHFEAIAEWWGLEMPEENEAC